MTTQADILDLHLVELRRRLRLSPLSPRLQQAELDGWIGVRDPVSLPADVIYELARMIDPRPMLEACSSTPLVSRSDDPTLLLPDQLAQESMPDFYGRLADRELAARTLQLQPPRITFFVDESASMRRPGLFDVPQILWAKALIVALLSVVSTPVEVVVWSGPNDQIHYQTPCRTLDDLVRHFFDGGTDIESGLVTLQRAVSRHTCSSQAVIYVVDHAPRLVHMRELVSHCQHIASHVNARCVDINLLDDARDSLRRTGSQILDLRQMVTGGH